MSRPTNKEIAHTLLRAQEEFWSVVAAHFPQITSGDFSPLDTVVFDLSCEKAVRAWIDTNYDETFTERQEAYRKDHPNAEEPF